MDAVEVLLFGVVGLSVVVFLIIDNLGPDHRKREETVYGSDRKARIEEIGCGRSVGGDGDAEKSEILEREDWDDIVTNAASCGKTEEEDSICREREGEREEVQEQEQEEYVEDDWEWEGVERSELEQYFGEAMVYANSKSNIINIGEDVKLQLYGLQKVALGDQSHHRSQPMALLHLSARSKWNAWQKVRNMSAEMAMENYIAILSEAIPDWNHNLQSKGEDTTTSEDLAPDCPGKHAMS